MGQKILRARVGCTAPFRTEQSDRALVLEVGEDVGSDRILFGDAPSVDDCGREALIRHKAEGNGHNDARREREVVVLTTVDRREIRLEPLTPRLGLNAIKLDRAPPTAP